MHRLKSLLVHISYSKRQWVTVGLATLGTWLEIFFGSVTISNWFHLYLMMMAGDIYDSCFQDGSINLIDMVRLYQEMDRGFGAICSLLMLIFSIISLGLAIYGVKKGNKYYPLAVGGMGFFHLLFSFIFSMIWKGELGETAGGIHLSRVVCFLLLAVSSGFWFFACDALDVYEAPNTEKLEEEPDTAFEKLIFFLKQRLSKVKSIHKCNHCGKILSKKGVYCTGCGMPVTVRTKGCKGCGATLATGAQFCPKCGTKEEKTP